MPRKRFEFATSGSDRVLIPGPLLVLQSDSPGVSSQDSFFFLYYTSVSSFINCICNDAHVIFIQG